MRPMSIRQGTKIGSAWCVSGPQAQEVLAEYLNRPATAYCFDPREAPSARKNSKHRYTKDSYGRAVRRAKDRINKRRVKELDDDAHPIAFCRKRVADSRSLRLGPRHLDQHLVNDSLCRREPT